MGVQLKVQGVNLMSYREAQLSVKELTDMLFGHLTNWGSVMYNGLRLDIAYQTGCFDETMFTLAFDQAQKKLANTKKASKLSS